MSQDRLSRLSGRRLLTRPQRDRHQRMILPPSPRDGTMADSSVGIRYSVCVWEGGKLMAASLVDSFRQAHLFAHRRALRPPTSRPARHRRENRETMEAIFGKTVVDKIDDAIRQHNAKPYQSTTYKNNRQICGESSAKSPLDLLSVASSVGNATTAGGGKGKRATTAVLAEWDAPSCNYLNRHGGRLTVPRSPGPPATLLRREMKRKATAALAALG